MSHSQFRDVLTTESKESWEKTLIKMLCYFSYSLISIVNSVKSPNESLQFRDVLTIESRESWKKT